MHQTRKAEWNSAAETVLKERPRKSTIQQKIASHWEVNVSLNARIVLMEANTGTLSAPRSIINKYNIHNSTLVQSVFFLYVGNTK